MRFPAHGGYHVESDREILVFVVVGAWNDISARESNARVIAEAEAIPSGRWGSILDASRLEGITPEGVAEARTLGPRLNNLGRSAAAYIHGESSVAFEIFAKPIIAGREQEVPVRVCRDREEALEWLHSLGYAGYEDGAKGQAGEASTAGG